MENKPEGKIKLFPFQKDVATTILSAFAAKKNALISLAPGYGRMVTIAWTLNELFKKGEVRRALIVTPRSEPCCQFIQTVNLYSSKSAMSLKIDSPAKYDLCRDLNQTLIAVSTLARFRKISVLLQNSFEIIFFDECQSLSEKDWMAAKKLTPVVVGFTPVHPIAISSRLFSFFGKQLPDYSYGISSIRLQELANISFGANYKTADLQNRGIWKFIRPRNITERGISYVDTFVSEDFAKEQTRSAVRVGDILLQNIFDFGKMAMVKEKDLPAIASKNLFIIRSKTIKPELLFEYLQSKAIAEAFHNYLENIADGAAIRHIRRKDVGEIPVPLPFAQNQLVEFAGIRQTKDINEIKRARDELAHLRRAFETFSGSEA